MKDMTETGRDIDGFSYTRESKYPTYIPGDARFEGFCTVNQLKARIETLEKLVEQLMADRK